MTNTWPGFEIRSIHEAKDASDIRFRLEDDHLDRTPKTNGLFWTHSDLAKIDNLSSKYTGTHEELGAL